MLHRLFAPLRTAATWRALVHAVLDFPVGLALTIPVFVMGILATALILLLPLSALVATALFLYARLAARVERTRVAALHGVALGDPVPPLPDGSAWAKAKSAFTTRARWKEIAYCLLRLPTGGLFAAVALVAWCGSLALVTLPLTIPAFPDDTAHFGLFDVTNGPESAAAALAGLVGLLTIAPWLTVLIGRLDLGLARWLLGPDRDRELALRATRAERSRAAAVDSAEAERRRIERDLHDGAQQRLVALAMDLGAARERLETDPEAGRRLVAEAHDEAKAALKEIRDLVRGIHPVILEDRGLDAALSSVIARSPVPVHLSVELADRPPPAVESAAYFVVSEALANVARHARASKAHVAIARRGDRVVVEVRDDGVGGADRSRGTGLSGLADRVTGMGGTMDLLSPPGGPTTLLVELPCAS